MRSAQLVRCEELVERINHSLVELRRLKSEDPSVRLGYWKSTGSILNAYREGDLTFDEAVSMLRMKVPDEA